VQNRIIPFLNHLSFLVFGERILLRHQFKVWWNMLVQIDYLRRPEVRNALGVVWAGGRFHWWHFLLDFRRWYAHHSWLSRLAVSFVFWPDLGLRGVCLLVDGHGGYWVLLRVIAHSHTFNMLLLLHLVLSLRSWWCSSMLYVDGADFTLVDAAEVHILRHGRIIVKVLQVWLLLVLIGVLERLGLLLLLLHLHHSWILL